MRLLTRLLRKYYRLITGLCYLDKHHQWRPSPLGQRLIPILPSPAVEWDNGQELRPVLVSRIWAQRCGQGHHEQALDQLIARCLKPGDVVIDVGAQVGLTAVQEALAVGPSGMVVALEPSPLNFPVLCKALQLNNCTWTTPLNLAAGAQEGMLGFSHEARAGLIQRVAGQDHEILIPVVRVDDIVREHSLPAVDFVKIDVDGPEMDVVYGMENLLTGEKPPFLCVECSRYWERFNCSFEHAFNWFTERGFSIWQAHRSDSGLEKIESPDALPPGWGTQKGLSFNFYCFKTDCHADRLANMGVALNP